MSTINREEMLKILTAVTPGLSPRPIVEQSDCFCFDGGKVITFHEPTACWTKCPLDLTGAVPAKPLLDILRARPEETLDIAAEDGKLVLRGKGKRRTRVLMEAKVTLPYGDIPKPSGWVRLPPDFLDAVDMVHRCCGKDEDKLDVYVHIHPERVEAIGESRVGHFRCKLPIQTDAIIHKESIKHVMALGMTHVCVSDKWLQFKNAAGVVLSCQQGAGKEDYPDTAKALKISGQRIELPRGLDGAVERAAVFSRENADDDEVLVKLKRNEVWIVGTGVSGDHQEPKKVGYDGPPLKFFISPKLLSDLCKKHTEAWVTADTLKVKSGKFTFITGLTTVEDREAGKQEESGEEAVEEAEE